MTPPRKPREADNNSHPVARGGASAVKYCPKILWFPRCGARGVWYQPCEHRWLPLSWLPLSSEGSDSVTCSGGKCLRRCPVFVAGRFSFSSFCLSKKFSSVLQNSPHVFSK